MKPKKKVETETNPPVADQSEAERVESVLAGIGRDYGIATETRYREFYSIWSKPKDEKGKKRSLRKDEIDELKSFGVIKAGTTVGNLIANAAACAEYISETYGYPFTRDDISKLRRGKKKPPIGNLPFPVSDSAGRFKKSQIDDWCKLSLPGADGVKAGTTFKKDARQRKEDADADVAEMAAERMRRQEDATWMKKTDAQMSATAAVLLHHSFVKNRLKDFTKRLEAGKFSEEQLQEIKDASVKVLEEIENDCESHA